MITFVYNNHTGVYDQRSRVVTWQGKSIKYSDVVHGMRIAIENASC
jgi:hypothetical protein